MSHCFQPKPVGGLPGSQFYCKYGHSEALKEGMDPFETAPLVTNCVFESNATLKLRLLVFPIKMFKFQTKQDMETKLHRLKW